MKKILGITLLISVLLTSCVTSTMVSFNGNVDGAEVYIDDVYMGETPLEVKMSNFVTEEPTIVIEKDGYEPYKGRLKKETKVINVITGILFYIPFLWCYGPKDVQAFRLHEGY